MSVRDVSNLYFYSIKGFNVVKKIILTVLICNIVVGAFAFDKGWTLGLRADFGGSLTLPSIPQEDLLKLNPLAKSMTGGLSNLLTGAQVSLGYIFDSNELFPGLNDSSAFSGVGVNAYLGFGQGNATEKISAVVEGTDPPQPLDIFIVVDYLPVISFGVEGEALFFKNRFSVGLGLGAKMIADMTPEYLAYATDNIFANGNSSSEVGTIIVTEEMMTKMNAFMFSTKLDLGYHVPILPTTELVLGFFTQFNLYKPKYLTVPASLASMGGLDPSTPLASPNFWLNSLDFGVNLGFLFKL